MTENAAVVVGVDGSEGSRAALRWSALEAHRRQLPLRIVVATGLDAVMPATASESFWRHLSAHQESWANDVVSDAADLARQAAPVEPQTAVCLTETAVTALQREAESAGLLVVGSRGRGAAMARLGSTAIVLTQQSSARSLWCPAHSVGRSTWEQGNQIPSAPPDKNAAPGPGDRYPGTGQQRPTSTVTVHEAFDSYGQLPKPMSSNM
jgi:nucleotide-binding universal stress UspA family protein